MRAARASYGCEPAVLTRDEVLIGAGDEAGSGCRALMGGQAPSAYSPLYCMRTCACEVGLGDSEDIQKCWGGPASPMGP